MKLLVLLQGYTEADQPSYHFAFQNAKYNGQPVQYRAIPYRGFVKDFGQVAFWEEVIRVNREFEPDAILFQFWQDTFHDEQSTIRCIDKLRSSRNHPLILVSQGDPFQPNRCRPWVRVPSKSLVSLASRADAFFSTSMGDLADYFVTHRAKNVILLPHAYAPQNFDYVHDSNQTEKEFDAIMVCSIGISRLRPIGSAIQVYRRWSDATALWRRYGKRFAVFGRGWERHPAFRGRVSFKDQVKTFASAVIGVDACPPVFEMYYGSDRPFFIAGAGALLVQRYTPRFEAFFEENVHINYASSTRTIVNACDKILNMDIDTRNARIEETLRIVKKHHLVSHRVDTIMSVCEAIVAHREGHASLRDSLHMIRNWHFIHGIDNEAELAYAVKNWQG